MEFIQPHMMGFTIYTKSGCSFCQRVKGLLTELQLPYSVIDCDPYLLEARTEFIEFIKERVGREYKTFPMVFLDGKFIGGYSEALSCLAQSS